MLYLGYYIDKVDEGGLARNSVFFKYFLKLKWEIKNFYPKTKNERLKNLYYGIFLLKRIKNRKIFFHINSIPIIFTSKLLEIRIYRELICKIFEKLDLNNKLIIEVNDLSFEQAKDLQLSEKKYWLEIEKRIYNLKNSHYIFASNLMRKYIVEKYNIKLKKTSVIINGGPFLKTSFLQEAQKYIKKNDKIKYVYAGSLNKGRQIEELIEIFKNKSNIELYLLGIWGEWIKDEINSENIFYLGNFEEDLAQAIVSQCDVGLIPYDETKFYYNICYPTKASFYITAGIPFLCTNLIELKNMFNKENIIWFKKIEDWNNEVLFINKKEVEFKKNNIERIKNKFIWTNLLKKLDKIIGF